MVKTSDASDYLTPHEVKHKQNLTIGPANTHEIITFPPIPPETKPRKRIVLGFAETTKKAILNNGSKRFLEKAYGYDTEKWAGKKVEIILTQQMIRSELTDVMFLVPPGTFDKGGMPKDD